MVLWRALWRVQLGCQTGAAPLSSVLLADAPETKIGTMDGALLATDMNTGDILWRFDR